jgi:hypothetical protein
VVDDIGRIVNPLTLHGQVIGATVQGLGSVFGEHLAYNSDGQLLVATLADYLVPLATDFPNLRAISLQRYPSPNNPLGAKGAGEGGVIPVGIWRRLNDGSRFPQPTLIAGRRFWRLSDLLAWEREQRSSGHDIAEAGSTNET